MSPHPAAARPSVGGGGGGGGATGGEGGLVATVATLSMPPALEAAVCAALAVWLPRATVAPVARADALADGGVDWVIVAPGVVGAAGLAELRRLRTSGYDGPVLLLVGEGVESSPGEAVELTRLGGRCCALGAGFAERLATAATVATPRTPGSAGDDRGMLGASGGDGGAGGERADRKQEAAKGDGDGRTAVTALHGELAETRRLLALAEVARRLPHALNNPLSALLAEAQLLELEELAPEQREATERIVQLARRVIVLVRELQLAQPRS
ncbi:MAG: histidine kinase dimerization/phospho-acceptor domain-containing protein [Gemmatimonadaceae bacterium]